MGIKAAFSRPGHLEEDCQKFVDDGWKIISFTWQETGMTSTTKGRYVVLLKRDNK